MAVRKAQAIWEGTLKEGKGTIKLGSGAYEGQYNFSSRFEEGTGTNPEELLGAAHAGCFAMKLNNMLHGEGHPPTKIDTTIPAAKALRHKQWLPGQAKIK